MIKRMELLHHIRNLPPYYSFIGLFLTLHQSNRQMSNTQIQRLKTQSLSCGKVQRLQPKAQNELQITLPLLPLSNMRIDLLLDLEDDTISNLSPSFSFSFHDLD